MGIADFGNGLLHIEIGIFKQANLEDIAQQAYSGLLEALVHIILAMFLDAHFIGSQYRLNVAVAAELVNTGHQGLIMTARFRILFHAPGGGNAFAQFFRHIMGHAPVGADNAIVFVLVAQQANLVTGEGAADLFAQGAVLTPGNGIGGHHGAGHFRPAREFEPAIDKGNQLGIELPAGIDGILAVFGMGFTTAFTDTITGPVFHHGVDAVFAPALVLAIFQRGLHTVHIGLCHIAGQCRVFAKGAIVARPARVGAQINLWGKACANA